MSCLALKSWTTFITDLITAEKMMLKGAAFFFLVCHIVMLGEAAAGAGGQCEDAALGEEWRMHRNAIDNRNLESSSASNSTRAENAGINLPGNPWCASKDDKAPYLTVSFENPHIICAIATQGNSKADHWVETYQLQSSTDGRTWTSYTEGGQVRDFHGNSDRNTVNKQAFESLVAKYVRVLPKAWHVLPCLRIELYGASAKPPFIEEAPMLHKALGGKVILSCTGESIPAPTVEWLKNGVKLADVNVETSGDLKKTSKLTIKEVKYDDQGNYSCAFINGIWNVSRTEKLVVYVPPEIFVSRPETLIVKKGEKNVTVKCVGRGYPAPDVRWFKGNKETGRVPKGFERTMNRAVQVASNGVISPLDNVTSQLYLSVTGIAYKEAGNYSCKATNNDTEHSAEKSIEVLFKPELDKVPQNVITEEGKTARFECRASGVPRPRITWSFGGGPLPAHSLMIINESLFINAVVNNPSYEGEYTCTAESRAGKITHTATLSVDPGSPYAVKATKQGRKYVILWKYKSRSLEFQVDWKVGETTEFDKSFFSTGSTNSQEINLESLNGDKNYSISVKAKTSDGWGEPSKDKVWVKTPITDPPPPAVPPTLKDTRKGITVRISIPEFSSENGKIIYYRVLVIRTPEGTKGKAPKPSEINPEDLVSHEDAHKSSDPAAYVTFQFKGSEYQKYKTFVVGGEQNSDSSYRDRREVTQQYFNGPLEPGTEYKIFARAYTGKDTYSSSKAVQINKVNGPVVSKGKKDNPSRFVMVLLISSLIAFIILAILIVIIVIFCVRRRQTTDDKIVQESKNLKQSAPHEVRVEQESLGKGTNV